MSETNLFAVNHEEAGGGNFEPITPGEYEVLVSEVEVTKSKSSGADMIKLTLVIRDDFSQDFKKRKVWDNIVYLPQMAWKVQQVYKAFGFDNNHKFEGIADVAKALQYKPVRIKIKHEMYNDKVQERVDYYTGTQAGKPAGAGIPADPFANDSTAPKVDDGDLPF